MITQSLSSENYKTIRQELDAMAAQLDRPPAELVAVTKTFEAEDIEAVIQSGCRVFGENRVQEAQSKWPALKKKYPDIELHLIGPLQSNKAKDAVALFDVIQTIDRKKIAKAVHREIERQSRTCRLFVQVNIGSEPQKAGIGPEEAQSFVSWCRNEEGIDITGLMCIPPFGENPGPYFALLRKLGRECEVKCLSMGMSSDYRTGVEFGATHVRVGSAIFGQR